MLSNQGVSNQALEVNDFSGGMTDKYVGADSRYFEKADNLQITDDRKLVTRPGLTLRSTSTARIPTEKRINKSFDSRDQLFEVSERGVYRFDTTYHEALGPSGNKAFSQGDQYSFVSSTKWNKHVFLANSAPSSIVKLFHDGTDWRIHQLGLPLVATSPTLTGTVSTKTYYYAFHYYYQYTSEGVLFEEVGPVRDAVSAVNVSQPSPGTPINITDIPVLANTASSNYDTANIKMKIFRTIENGSEYFLVGEVTNGVTTFSDTILDTPLQENDTLYITGDIPDHEPPPASSHLHLVNDILWLAQGNKLRISNRFMPWSCPGAFEEEFDEEIRGISSINIYPIVFCENKVYRIEGFYLPDGSGGVQKRQISEKAGCVSASSIVQTEDGVFWAGNDGFYHTDGSNVTRVSELFNITYKKYTKTELQRSRICGTYHPTLQVVLWAAQFNEDSTDNDTVFVCHLKFGIKPEMAFTTWSGSATFAPTSLHYFDGNLYHADTRGYLLKYDDAILTDPKIDVDSAANTWFESAIIYLYLSPAYDFGTGAMRKWVPGLIVHADNASSISLLVSANNDNGGLFKDLQEIHYKGNVSWGDYDIVWGDQNLRWNYFPIISAKRRFPAGGLRCSYKQLRFTNAFSEIDTSSNLGPATFDNLTNQVVLDDATQLWGNDLLDYYISQSSDNYIREYRILGRTDSTLTLEDIDNHLLSGSSDWVIKGYRRREILKLISYVIAYSHTSPSQDSFRAQK